LSTPRANQTIALAGVFQAADLVQQIAHTGQCDEALLETSIRSLFVTNPDTTEDVFGDLPAVRDGLKTIHRVMVKQTAKRDIEVLRYGLNLIHLERHLAKQPEMLEVISSRLEQAEHSVRHFGYTHGNVIRNIASIYVDTISTFRLRINVTGEPGYLQMEDNAARIRALLLAGIRAAMLWRQVGGRRWQLIFMRGRVVDEAHNLLNNIHS